jgi:4-hydroxybenzoate polyprenyltransferase
MASWHFVSSLPAFISLMTYRDIRDDRRHPVKCKRPLASGHVKKPTAILICILLLVLGTILGYLADHTLLFLFILGLYFFMNLAYSFGLKNIAILDILILSAGFVLRVKGGQLFQSDT